MMKAGVKMWPIMLKSRHASFVWVKEKSMIMKRQETGGMRRPHVRKFWVGDELVG
jgi:hypothetical protein